MKVAKDNAQWYEFGEFRLEPDERLLWREGEPISLTPKAFETLLVLVENNGQLLTNEDFLQRIWPHSTIEETTLAQDISTLRKALGNQGQQFIQTIPQQGYRFTANVTQVSSNSAAPSMSSGNHPPTSSKEQPKVERDARSDQRPKLLPYQLTIALLLIVVPTALAYFVFFGQPPKTTRASINQRSLAVLPFLNLKQEAATDFLGFSMASAIITKLGYVPALAVRPSSYVDKYRSQGVDPKRVAVELNINTLLTGTYIKEGNDLRITAQLVDVLTNEILWKDALELEYENLMTIQDRVVQEVIRHLQLNLTAAETMRIKRDPPQNPLAYEYYLRGVDLYAANRLPRAIEMLEKSLALDANYAPAWSHLGSAYTAQAAGNLGERDDYAQAQVAYQKALALNPEQNEARISMAILLTDTNRVEEAVPLLRDVLKENPSLARAHWELSYAYRFAGMLKESIAEAEQARLLDTESKASHSVPATYLYIGQYQKFLDSLPRHNSAHVTFYRGLGIYYLKDFTRAATEFNRAYQINDEMMQTNVGKAYALALANEPQQGLRQLRDTEKIAAARGLDNAEAIYKIAQGYAVLGDKVAALRALRRSIEGGFFCYPYFANDPLLDNLRGESEYARLMQIARQRHDEFRRQFLTS